jgi:hypothetical protein
MRANFGLKTGLALALFLGGMSYAARKPQDFQEPAKMTDEEVAAAKARSKGSMNSYGETQSDKPKEFPIYFAVLVGIAFMVAIPFAVRAYSNTSKEIGGNKALGPPPRRSKADVDAESRDEA